MRKRLEFLYRYITAPHRLSRWLNVQTLLVLLLAVLFVAVLAWTTALSEAQRQERAAERLRQTAEALAQNPDVLPAPTATPLPEEFLNNSDQTIGITLVGAGLVVIVVLGLLVYVPKQHEGP